MLVRMTYKAAVIGTGENPDDPNRDGFAMGYRHGAAYRQLDDCTLVACADIVRSNAERFAEEFGIDAVYEDYERMIAEVEPDIVSVCVPPAVHAEIVIGCAESGAVGAIHCEKPMATTWADCRRMVQTCEAHGVRLTFSHQRRFGEPFRRAKALLDEGAIGELVRMEFSEDNLFDAGSHQFDLCGYFTSQTPVEWVIGQVHYDRENLWFGTHNENQALAQWRYRDGVHGLASMGPGTSFVGCYFRLVGSGGEIEIGVENGPTLRIRRRGSAGWEEIDTDENIHGPKSLGRVGFVVQQLASRLPGSADERLDRPTFHDKAIEEVVRTAREGTESELSAQNALMATELIFAVWESARRCGRVDLPLDIDDNPLEAMIEAGRLKPSPARPPTP